MNFSLVVRMLVISLGILTLALGWAVVVVLGRARRANMQLQPVANWVNILFMLGVVCLLGAVGIYNWVNLTTGITPSAGLALAGEASLAAATYMLLKGYSQGQISDSPIAGVGTLPADIVPQRRATDGQKKQSNPAEKIWIVVLSFMIVFVAAFLVSIQSTQDQKFNEQQIVQICAQHDMLSAIRGIERKLGLPFKDIVLPNTEGLNCP